MKKVLVWVSAGDASAVAYKKAVEKYGPDVVEGWYCDTSKYEHKDNQRFLGDVGSWVGVPIKIGKTREAKYLDENGQPDIFRVFEETGWLVGPGGARCTIELKKQVRHDIEKGGEIQIFGFTIDEEKRIKNFNENNPEILKEYILYDQGITKSDCHRIIREAGIRIPTMYLLGYKNNNCIGCVKGGSGYWNKIRMDFPDYFNRMALVERKMNVAINKRYEGKTRIRVFLDELPPDAGRYDAEPDIECGVVCQNGS